MRLSRRAVLSSFRWPLLAAALVGALVTSPGTRATAKAQAGGQARIFFVDIGQGASTLIVSPAGKSLLVDGGPNGGGTGKIVPLLNALGIATVDFTVVTHYHIDHDAGVTEVLNANRVNGIAYDNGDGADVAPPNAGGTRTAYLNYVAATARPGVTRRTILPGEVLDLGGGMRATAIVTAGHYVSGASLPVSTNDLNSQSIGLLVEYNDFDFFVAGDLTGGGSTTTARGPDLETFAGQAIGDVDVVQLDHHGSTTSNNQRFEALLKAETAFAQIGTSNTFGHPHREVVNRYLNTPATSGNSHAGTGVPPAGTGPVMYQTQASPSGDSRVTQQGYSGASASSAGLGTLLLETDGATTYSVRSFDDGGVRVAAALHTYNVDAASPGVTTDFKPTVIPEISPAVPLASDPVVVEAAVNDRESPIASVLLTYSVNGAAQPALPMSLVGLVYRATIPAQPDGTRVDYGVTAVAGGQSTSYASGYFSGTTPIAALRGVDAKGETLYPDYAARVVGVVTAGTGTFSNSGNNDDYVQDASAGINVFRTTQPSVPAIQPTSLGQTVEIRGRIGSVDGRLRLELTPPFDSPTSPYGVGLFGGGPAPTPTPVTLSQLSATPEAFEGQLVSVANCSIGGSMPTAPASLDAFLPIGDGTGSFLLKVDHDTDIPGLAKPTLPITCVGVVQQDDTLRPFNGSYSVTPRDRADLGAPVSGATLISIADARADAVDNADGNPPGDFVPDLLSQVVRVRGAVTSIDFRGGAGIEYYIQDATGGIDVFSTTASPGPFNVGDSVEVVGTLSHFNGLTEIVPGAAADVTLLPAGTLPAVTPQLVTLSQLADGGVGEALEGRLVRIENVTIASGSFPASGATANVTIQDGTGSAVLRIDSDTNIDGTPTPAGTFGVVGLVGQFDTSAPLDDGYQIFPRSTSDIVAAPAPALSVTPASISFGSAAVGSSAAQAVTLRNSGGATLLLAAPLTIVGPSASQFSVGAPGTTTLAPGASTTASVTFLPTSSGAKSATLNVATLNDGSASVTLSGTGSAAAGAATDVVISEFRVRGPSGGNDEFVEIYNPTDAAIPIGGWKMKGSNSAGTTSTRATVLGGTTLAPHAHFLFTNTAASGYSGSVPGNQTYSVGITDDGGIAITRADDVIVDQVGLSSGSAFKEGTPLASLGTSNQNRGYERKLGGVFGSGQDSGDNATDFALKAPSDPQNLASSVTPALAALPASVGFGVVTLGTSATTTVTLTNNGNAAITLGPASIAGTDVAAFSVAGLVASSLAPGASTTLDVTFLPMSSGAKSALLSVGSGANPVSLPLSGTGNAAPVAAAGADQSLVAGAGCVTSVSLDGSASSDPDDATLGYSWSGPFGTADGAGAVVSLAAGTHTILLTVTDASGASSSDTLVVTVTDAAPPSLVLLGDNPLQHEAGTPFGDPGATAQDECAGGLTGAIETSSNVAPDAPGSYTIVYAVDDGHGNTASATRVVNVVDSFAPTLTLNGANPLTLECHGAFTDPGATATDGVAGDLSAAIQAISNVNVDVPGSYTITYSVSDPSGNSASATRVVNVVDTLAPTLTLLGANPLTHELGTPFSDPGATAQDACAGNLTGALVKTSNVNANVLGTYTVSYAVSDGSGHAVTVSRTVKVVDTTPPDIEAVRASPHVLWPPNGDLERVTIRVSTTDEGGTPACRITDVDSDEPQRGHERDWIVTGPLTLKLRAERDERRREKDGRTYTISVTCRDASGNDDTETTTVIVPHDRRRGGPGGHGHDDDDGCERRHHGRRGRR